MKQITMPLTEYEDELVELQEQAFDAGFEAGQNAIVRLITSYPNVDVSHLTNSEKTVIQKIILKE